MTDADHTTGTVLMYCDHGPCPAFIRILMRRIDWKRVDMEAKALGWRNVPDIHGGWLHYCPKHGNQNHAPV